MLEPSRPPSSTDSQAEEQRASSPPDYDPKLEKQAVRKLDYTILPVMTMFYLLSFLDRANIGNARVAGLEKDLGMTDKQYQICVTVLYVPYIMAELPSNLLLRRLGPALVMPSLLTIWGMMVALQGLVKSFTGLVVVRAFLGLVEGPMFPGIVLYLSGFYTRRELSLRIAIFFSAASLSGAFSGLLAAAIELMDGIGGRPGWAWIFILEGLFTVCIGLLAFFLVPSTPRQSRFLTHEQKDIIMARLERDRPSIRPADKFSLHAVLQSPSSPHVILVFIMFFMCGTTLYGLALFLPTIVKEMGFSANKTQLLSVGPFASGFFVTVVAAFWSDRYDLRGIPTAMISSLAVIGFAIFLGANNKHAEYGALFLMVPGVYATVPTLSAWMSNNSEPYYRRATSVALGFVATNSGGILSTWMYPTKEGPRYRKTTIMNLIFSILVMVGSFINMFYLSRMNKRKEDPEYRAKLLAKFKEDESDGELKAWMELGDRHPDFRYTL